MEMNNPEMERVPPVGRSLKKMFSVPVMGPSSFVVKQARGLRGTPPLNTGSFSELRVRDDGTLRNSFNKNFMTESKILQSELEKKIQGADLR